MGTAIWVVAVLVLIWLLFLFVRRNDKPIRQPFRSQLSKGMISQGCETCDKSGAIRLDKPWIKLSSIADQLAYANQSTCPCCQGLAVHWIPSGGKYRCMRYEEKRCASRDIRRIGNNGG